MADVVETGEKRDTRGRRMTPAVRRRQLVQAYRASGLTMAGFAWLCGKRITQSWALAGASYRAVPLPHSALGVLARLEFAAGGSVRRSGADPSRQPRTRITHTEMEHDPVGRAVTLIHAPEAERVPKTGLGGMLVRSVG